MRYVEHPSLRLVVESLTSELLGGGDVVEYGACNVERDPIGLAEKDKALRRCKAVAATYRLNKTSIREAGVV